MTAQLAQFTPTPEEPLAKRRVLVWGLGRFGGGVGVTRWLISQGALVTVTDQATAENLADSMAALSDLPVTFHLGGECPTDLDAADLVIVNPAVVKWKSPFFREIAARNIPWTTEINLFCQRCPATVVGVTGSYGKSTTSAMLFEVLDHACKTNACKFRKAHLGGNIGKSLLTDLGEIAPDDVVILELSNAQLEDLPQINWAPACAVITNIYPHHLDRYQSPAEYFAAKANIARDPANRAPLITGPLDPRAESLVLTALAEHPDRLIRIPPPSPPAKLTVPGDHNQSNAACVLTVARTLGLNESATRESLQSFRGLPHRLEFVRSVDGVDYINDSKSTAPGATIKALESFDRTVILIVGGQKKDVPWNELAEVIPARCRAVVCMGESATSLATILGGTPVTGSMSDAVNAARRLARHGDVVLLSPGAPSFDAYHNYEQRGRDFAECVNNLSP